jgi:flavorubredoxin
VTSLLRCSVDLSVSNNKYSYASTIGNGVATSYTVTHNLNSRDVDVQLYDLTTNETVISDVVRNTVNAVVVSFTNPPATGSIRVLVKKIG